jgi:hypothetical protein
MVPLGALQRKPLLGHRETSDALNVVFAELTADQ